MSEQRFKLQHINDLTDQEYMRLKKITDNGELITLGEVVDLLNEQQELIEELQVSDEMGWKRAERFEKKCPKELHNKKMYIKRLEYKVQKFKEENEQLKIANARWLDKSLQDRQIRYSNTNHKELTKKYLQLQEENEQLKQGFNELLAVHTKVMQTLDDEFVSKALADDNGDGV